MTKDSDYVVVDLQMQTDNKNQYSTIQVQNFTFLLKHLYY